MAVIVLKSCVLNNSNVEIKRTAYKVQKIKVKEFKWKNSACKWCFVEEQANTVSFIFQSNFSWGNMFQSQEISTKIPEENTENMSRREFMTEKYTKVGLG